MKDSVPAQEALVLPHTHWDRAWYWPYERFRVKLCACFDVMISMLQKYPDYHFTCDGQTAMIEDYLEVCPENRAVLQAFAAEGRLHTGPMYCLSDVYCTGAEPLIRNLLIGMEWAGEFGGLMRVIYMPDTFGITPNLPSICSGFGVRTFIFMRGHPGEVPDLVSMRALGNAPQAVPVETRMFRWRAPDASEVRVFRLRDGYANAAGLGVHPQPGMPPENLDQAAARLEAAAAKQDDAQGAPLGLMAGVDHQIPQSRLPEVMQLAEKTGRYRYRFAGIDALDEPLGRKPVEELPLFEGEFHGSGAASVLGGTLSTRIYLKQKNALVERALSMQAEPASALVPWLERSSIPGVCGLLKAAWKQLLQTHPHDDICGCSIDAVHRSNEQQMENARHAADAIRRSGVIELFRAYGGNAPGDMRPSFMLLNTQAVRRSGPADFVFDFEGQRRWGDIQLPQSFRIVDEAGREVPFREVERGQSTEHPRKYVRVEAYADLPPMTFRRYYLESADNDAAAAGAQLADSIENEWLTLKIDSSGIADVIDKKTGDCWRFGQFSGQADIGDSYDFSDIPGEPEELLSLENPQIRTLPCGGGLKGLAVEGVLAVPASANAKMRKRSRRKVSLPVRVEWTLAPGSRHAGVRILLTNRARDHRLRWNLFSPLPIGETLAGLKMQTVRHPAGTPPMSAEAPRIFPEFTGDEFVAFRKGATGVACFSQFPFNFEVADPSRLAITILRAVGFLCNPTQTATRAGTNAGPHTATPDAQCLGRTLDFRFAVRPFSAAEEDRLLMEALLWRHEPVYGQMDATVRYVEKTSQPDPSALVVCDEPLYLSACKCSLDGCDVVLRFFNPFNSLVDTRVRFAEPVRIVACGLDEVPRAEESAEAAEHAVHLAPKAFLTLRVRKGRRNA